MNSSPWNFIFDFLLFIFSCSSLPVRAVDTGFQDIALVGRF
jgi:hypothetical protein